MKKDVRGNVFVWKVMCLDWTVLLMVWGLVSMHKYLGLLG